MIPVWTVLLLGWITAAPRAGIGGVFFNGSVGFSQERILWIAFVGFSFIAAFIYIVNQIADVESDRINHKLFILPRGLISIRTAWVCAVLYATLGMIVSIVWLDSVMSFLFLCGIMLGILYSLPPVSLKNHAWGGVIANFLGHGVLTFFVGWYAADYGKSIDVLFIVKGLLASLTAGFANAAVFITTTIPDAEGDRLTGKKTFCVCYGEKKTALAAAVSCGLALVFCTQLEHNAWIMSVTSVISLILFAAFVFATKRELAFKTFRWPVLILSLFVAVFVPLYGIIVVGTIVVSRVYYRKRFNIEYPTLKSK